MEHVKVKCGKKKYYPVVKTLLNMQAIDCYQKAPDKPIHICGYKQKEEIETLLKEAGLSGMAVAKLEKPDFQAMEEEPER
jgi:hypothetical protein